ncbi:MAG: Hpt domain-containing protein [Campylobacterota bacterium]|nr:Hpt domain-containing protein [Campylobacterota bacterium]
MDDTINSSQRDITLLYSEASLYSRIKVAQAHVKLDNAEMKEIIDQYINDTPVMFKQLNTAWIKSDYENIILYAHSIVGVARILKLDEVSEYAKALEDKAKERKRSEKKVLKLLNDHHHASLKTLCQLFS